MPKGLVIGIGNRQRGDDGAGCAVADRLLAGPHPGFDIVSSDGDVARLMEWFRDYDPILIVDAAACARRAGPLQWNAAQAPLPAERRWASSHAMGLAEAIELGRALGRLPRRLTVYGVPAREFGWQEGLSPLTARAVERTAARIEREWRRGLTEAPAETPAIHARSGA